MSVPAVHWHEGMFLRPHHFQAAERFYADQGRRSNRFDTHHNWGLRAIDFDAAALRNYRFEVRRLEARLRDGTVVVTDHDHDPLTGLDLRPVMADLPAGGTADVLLGTPVLQLGRANATAGSDARVPDRRPGRARGRRKHWTESAARAVPPHEFTIVHRRTGRREWVRNPARRPVGTVGPSGRPAPTAPVVYPPGAGVRRVARAGRCGARAGLPPRRHPGQADRPAGPRAADHVRQQRPGRPQASSGCGR